VMCGDRPHTVPRGVVEALIEVTDASGVLQLGSKLRSGGAVRVMAGPFAEQIVILNKLDGSRRVRVLLHIRGRQVPVSTDANHLLPLQ
jgi:transcription antitermination factor NusG